MKKILFLSLLSLIVNSGNAQADVFISAKVNAGSPPKIEGIIKITQQNFYKFETIRIYDLGYHFAIDKNLILNENTLLIPSSWDLNAIFSAQESQIVFEKHGARYETLSPGLYTVYERATYDVESFINAKQQLAELEAQRIVQTQRKLEERQKEREEQNSITGKIKSFFEK